MTRKVKSILVRLRSIERDSRNEKVYRIHIFNAIAFPFSGVLSNGLRAAGGVKFTMYVSVLSTIAGRLFLSYLLGIVFHLGVVGIAVAMVCDWVIRAIIFIWRQKSGKWKEFQVI